MSLMGTPDPRVRMWDKYQKRDDPESAHECGRRATGLAESWMKVEGGEEDYSFQLDLMVQYQ